MSSVSTDERGVELSIGQVASMTRLTIRALRHYDDIGLLRPARVDPSSGYRYYAPDQIEVAGTIAVLRGLGIDTTTTAGLLAGTVDIGSVIEEEQRRLMQIERQRRDSVAVLNSLGAPLQPTEPTIEYVDAFSMFGTHARVPTSDDIALVGAAFEALFGALAAASIDHDGDGICVIHRNARDELWLDIGVRTGHRSASIDGYEYLDIGAARTARIVYCGPLASLPLGHARLAAWIHENGLVPAGPSRETYLGALDDQRTEIAVPLAHQG